MTDLNSGDAIAILADRICDLEASLERLSNTVYTIEVASTEEIVVEVRNLRSVVALLQKTQSKYQKDTQRRLLLCLLAIGVLAIAISPWLDSTTKGAGLTGAIGLIGIVISRGESSGR